MGLRIVPLHGRGPKKAGILHFLGILTLGSRQGEPVPRPTGTTRDHKGPIEARRGPLGTIRASYQAPIWGGFCRTLQQGLKVTSGTVEWCISSCGTDFDNSEIASSVEPYPIPRTSHSGANSYGAMAIGKIRCVVFDLDDTLWNTATCHLQAG